MPSGSAIDTGSAGTFTFTVNASDDLGNATPKSVTYTVGKGGRHAHPDPVERGQQPAGRGAPAACRRPTGRCASPRHGGVAGAVPEAATEAPATDEQSEAKPERSAPATTEEQAPAEPPAAKPEDDARPVRQELTAYDPRSEPEKTFGILAAGFTLLGLAVGGGGLARGGGVSKPSSGSAKSGGGSSRPGFSGLSSYQGVEIRHLAAGFGAVALGDRSRTWKWPATDRVDYLAAAHPGRRSRAAPRCSDACSPTARTCARSSARHRCCSRSPGWRSASRR